MKVSLAIVLGIFRALVIPVQSEDCPATLESAELSAAVSRSAEYLSYQFRDVTEFSFDLTSPVTLAHACTYYGTNGSDRKDALVHEAVVEACTAVNESVDFSRYDNDGDGVVDAVIVVFPGIGEAVSAVEDAIWPQTLTIDSKFPSVYCDGKRISSFISLCESGLVGTLCHEMMHIFGLVDLYDVDGPASGGVAKGMWGSTSVTDRGGMNNSGQTPPNLNAIELEQLGIGTADTLRAGRWNLVPGQRHYIKIASKSAPSEYYLIESRAEKGWDEYIGGSGLLVYHVDKSDRYAGYSEFYRVTLTAFERWQKNLVNCRPDIECADLVEALPEAESVGQVFFPQPGHDCLSSESNPPLRFADGTAPSLAIVGITKEPDGSVSFNAIEPLGVTDVFEFQTAALLCWRVDEALTVSECYVTWTVDWAESSTSRRAEASLRSDGVWTCRMSGLDPKSSYRATIHLVCDDGTQFSQILQLRTKSIAGGTFPYIYLPNENRNPDGTFRKGAVIPLQVYNAREVAEVKWYFGGLPVAESTQFLILKHGGELRAEVYYTMGGRDVIIKLLTVNDK